MYSLSGEPSVGSFGWAGVVNDENIHGYRSIAVPGCVAGLAEAHQRFGNLPWSEVVAPAANIARNGFSPEWFTLYKLGGLSPMLLRYTELRETFMPDNQLPYGGIEAPYILKQPNLANTLDSIARDGANSLYRGELTENITRDIQSNGGI